MRTRLWSFIVIASLFFGLSGCAHLNKANLNKANTAHNKNAPPPKPIVQTRKITGFNRISVVGQMNVRLHTGFSKTEVILHGDARDLAQVIAVVNNSTLSIRLTTTPKFGEVTADIRGNQLNFFDYRGAGVVKGDNIHSGLLDVYISNPAKTILNGQINLHKLMVKGPGFVEINGIKSPYLEVALQNRAHVQLTGIAKLARLDIQGQSWFALYWLSNDFLSIRAKDSSFIQLAGVVNKIDLELWGQARFNGRFLRASRTFVKTHNRAIAEINSIDRQHTLATDSSDIRFYNVPVLKSDFMGCNGAVLDMRDWNNPEMQEYNRYNKDVPLGDRP